MRFKIDWASLIVGSKFTVFALFYFVFEGNFPSTSPRGAYIWRGDLMEGFLHYEFTGLIFGGAYCRNFTVFNSFIPSKHSKAFPRQFQFLINRPPYLNSLIIYVLILSMSFFCPSRSPYPSLYNV